MRLKTQLFRLLGLSLLWCALFLTPGQASAVSNVNHSFISGANGPCGVAVDANFIYWANEQGSTIGRAKLDGTGVTQNFITGASQACGVAVDGSYIYWAGYSGGGHIGRARLDGTNVVQSFVTILPNYITPCGVAVDANYIYWGNRGVVSSGVGRSRIDGTDSQPFFSVTGDGLRSPCGVAVDANFFYYANSGPISGSTIGRGANANFITGTKKACGVAIDANFIYWANRDDAGGGSLGRANLDGTGADQSYIIGASQPCGVAVNANYVYWANWGTNTIGRANLRLDQTISFNPPATGTLGTSIVLSATGGASGNPVVFSIDPMSGPGVCSLLGAVLSFTGSGTCVVNANQAGNVNYAPAPQVQRTINIGVLAQTIRFTAPPNGSVGTSTTLSASGGASGNPVVFSIDASSGPGVCDVSGPNGTTLSFRAAGICIVNANQAGNANHAAALQVQQTITVGGVIPSPPVIPQVFQNPAAIWIILSGGKHNAP